VTGGGLGSMKSFLNRRYCFEHWTDNGGSERGKGLF